MPLLISWSCRPTRCAAICWRCKQYVVAWCATPPTTHRIDTDRLHLDGCFRDIIGDLCGADRNRPDKVREERRLHRERRMNALEIKTHYSASRPLRNFDWSAWWKDEESDGRVGYGRPAKKRSAIFGELPRNGRAA